MRHKLDIQLEIIILSQVKGPVIRENGNKNIKNFIE